MRLMLRITILIMFCSSPLVACDVDLLSLVSGKRPSSVFASNVGRLVKDVQDVGQNVFTKDKVQVSLKKLMLSWVRFDTQYGPFPPSWAKKDVNWKIKIKTIANQIGLVKKLLGEGKDVVAHTNILSISRKITGLLEYMPMSAKEKILLHFPVNFDLICEALKSKNNEILGALLPKVVAEKNQLRTLVASSTLPITDEFSSWIDSLEKTFKEAPPKMYSKLNTSLGFVEEAFNKMNTKLKDLEIKK